MWGIPYNLFMLLKNQIVFLILILLIVCPSHFDPFFSSVRPYVLNHVFHIDIKLTHMAKTFISVNVTT